MKNKTTKIVLSLLLTLFTITLALFGCNPKNTKKKVRLDPKNPVPISIWHYYNGTIMNAFESMVQEFNESVGTKEGIFVESYAYGNVSDLEQAVISSAKKEAGSMDMPNIFASYADTAYEAEKMGILANLDEYFSKQEQDEYFDSYIEEGKIGLNGELRIFPIAKSTEVFILNETDWLPFAKANNLTYEDLANVEDVTRVAKAYYDWTNSQTPDVPNDGKAFFGRDSMANFFIITSKRFQTEIFQVENGLSKIQINKDVMKKIWDNYYVPYISGYFTAYGRFRSDDAKAGDILAYVGATSSVSYFPNEVTVGGNTYPIQAKVLPVPQFKESDKVLVQQGAGMVVTKGTPEEEYASSVFLKWFTDTKYNVEFASLSGYMPVKKEANDYEVLSAKLAESDLTLDRITEETLKVSLDEIKSSELYTNKAFDGANDARNVLEHHLQDKAAADREAVLTLLDHGITLEEAVAQFDTEDAFHNWLQEFTVELNEAAGM